MGEVHVKFGSLLRLERERRNLTLAEISHDLKISETNLQYIEAGDVEALPAQLYFGLFGKSYAELLGIDYAQTLEAIREDLGEPIEANGINGTFSGLRQDYDGSGSREGQEAKPGEARDPQKSASRFIIPIGALIVAGIALLWYMLAPHAKISLFQDSEPQVSETDQDSAGVKSDGQTEKLPPAKLNLKLVARDRTWALVMADGDTALATNLKPWREYPIRAQERLVVSISSPLSVDVTLNGMAIDLSDPEKGNVEAVEISEANMERFKRREPTDTVSSDSGLGDTMQGYTLDALPLPDSAANTDSSPSRLRKSAPALPGRSAEDGAKKHGDSARGNRGL